MVLFTWADDILCKGFVPAFSCSHKALNSISWYFNLRGSLVDGNFIPIGEFLILLPWKAAPYALLGVNLF